ncbi:hypothetical protein GCK72_003999 [Caenorhabditis remanei]|uniref:Uncharacterized protein n=1 Tax=Caenorhabditis remanei TaxID=31234 RepID=A0A6A5HCF3_CAERE|nr:hypothetical protein GCK72_003999 [Caenorhabditis remanei]KAF1764053.1 hypothetical protein GCK72_003999 [Caenorhabditis remanei]
MRQYLLLVPLLCWLLPVCHGGIGSALVQGRLLCHKQPFAGEKVEIWAKAWGMHVDQIIRGSAPFFQGFFDKLLDSTTTDAYGYFALNGSYYEALATKPMIYAYFVNYCEPAIRKESFVCGNSIKAYIPSSFITSGKNPLETFHLDELEVSTVENQQFGLEAIVYSWFDRKECRDE